MNSPTPVNLETCADEPIHIPGSIQSHGAVVVFDDDLIVVQASANLADFVSHRPEDILQKRLPEDFFPKKVVEALEADASEGPKKGVVYESFNPLWMGELEVSIHHHQGLWFAEFIRTKESERSNDSFVLGLQRALGRMQGADNVDDLLDSAVRDIRRLTKIDRVMAYRFLPDGHGQVVAEACKEGIGSYLGMHYPASDIPPQARRLYSINPLRLITDVRAKPVPLVPHIPTESKVPTDLSLCVLRSVSPIHCEYLTNMGVCGSMSVSIIVEGKLWGLIACHHYSPLSLSFGERLTAHMMGQTMGVLISQLELKKRQRKLRIGRRSIMEAMKQVEEHGDVIAGLRPHMDDLQKLMGADGIAISANARVMCFGDVPGLEWIAGLTRWLSSEASEEIFATENLSSVYPDDVTPPSACGLLAIPFHKTDRGFVLFFRKESCQTLNWAGNPDDGVKCGPLGTRLTPRGSFELFKKTTSGQSEHWTEVDVALGRELAEHLTRRVLEWTSEQDRLRNLLVGIVGHDLRTPLGAIKTGAQLLGTEHAIGKRMTSSSARMTGLVEALMDLNQIQSDRGLALRIEEFNLHEACTQLVDEVLLAFPGTIIETEMQGEGLVKADRDRLGQAIANLLSNARHHGDSGRPILLKVLDAPEGDIKIAVHNWGKPIDAESRDAIFKPYQGIQRRADRKSGGLGLGLYITQSIVRAHGGTITVRSSLDEGTTFELLLRRTAMIDVDGPPSSIP